MNELQRMQYLDAMGIDSFVPRFLITGAKPPVLCALPEPSDQPELASADSLNRIALDIGKQTIGQVMLGERTDENLVSEEKASPSNVDAEGPSSNDTSSNDNSASKTDPVKTDVKAVAFSLAAWRPSKDVFVVDACQPGDALPTHSLLSNMLQSLELLELNLPKAEILHWPMVQGPHDASWSAAIQMVRGFLDGKLLTQPAERLLLFGKDAVKAVIGEDFDWLNTVYKSIPLAEFDCEATILPSLTELLYKPELKKHVWLALKRIDTAAHG